MPRVYHGATAINNESIVIFGGKNVNQKSASFYVLKPKELKIDLDIEEEDESSGEGTEGDKKPIPKNQEKKSEF